VKRAPRLGLVLVLALGPRAAAEEAPAPAVEKKPAAEQPELPPGIEFVRIPGTRVSLKRPHSMYLARNVSGLATRDGQITVVVTELQRPLSTARKYYSPEVVPAMGLVMIALSEVEIAGYPGFVAYLRQADRYAIWLAAFGDEQESVVVQGQAPFKQAPKVTETIHEMLVSAQWHREEIVSPFHGLDFELAGKLPLKYAVRVGTDIHLTRSGDLRKSADEVELVVSQHTGKIAKEKRDDFCKTQLEETPGVGLTSAAQQADVRIDGLDGCEMMVAGRDLAAKRDILVYQLLLFDVDRYYLFRGRVGWEQQFRFVNLLLETARSFKRRG
jgi:hypothetical protein